MASHLHDRTATLRQQPQLPWIVSQALLVPEGMLLLVVLTAHWLSGGAGVITLLGLLLIAVFVTRLALLAAARHALANTQYERARRCVAIALRLHPWSADALALRGAISLARGQAAQAEESIRKAMALFPAQSALHATLSSVLLELDRGVEARWEGMRALALDPTCASAYLSLAQVEQRMGAPATEVERRLRQGLAHDAEPAIEGALRCALALVLISLGQTGESRLAVAGVESLAARCSPVERAALLYQLGEVRRAQGETDAARGHFRTSEQLDPQGRHAAAAWRAARM